MTCGKDTWWIKLDYDWMRDEKVIEVAAKYGRGVLVDVVNSFVLMSKCGGLADMAKPAHVEWAKWYMGKRSVKALYATFDKLAEFGIIDRVLWDNFGHVTSNRAAADAARASGVSEAKRSRTEKARRALAEKRSRGSVTESVTDTVTDSVTDVEKGSVTESVDRGQKRSVGTCL